MKRLSYLFIILLAFSCYVDETVTDPSGAEFTGKGYRPVYESPDELANVKAGAPIRLSHPGKLYSLGNYLFINEFGKGIHVIDNTDKTNPVNLSFIAIKGNFDMAAKGAWLYADNLTNLVVLDISNPKAPKLVKYIENAIEKQDYPPFQNVFFECVDSKKGVVVSWELVEMSKPKYYR